MPMVPTSFAEHTDICSCAWCKAEREQHEYVSNLMKALKETRSALRVHCDVGPPSTRIVHNAVLERWKHLGVDDE